MPAYYANLCSNFLERSISDIEHTLVESYAADRFKELFVPQIEAWKQELSCLQDALRAIKQTGTSIDEWGIALEFVIPRKMGRIDAVLLIGDAIVVLEFKTKSVDSSSADQVEDYCLDLLYFHRPSHNRTIYPVVVVDSGITLPGSRRSLTSTLPATTFVNANDLQRLVSQIGDRHASKYQISVHEWDSGEYHPVPTIVEAAIGMFAEMEVSDIANAGTAPINLTKTVSAIGKFVRESQVTGSKTICFVTGVPGAGKTLAGLRVVHDGRLRSSVGADSVFLTGNLPLVKVLQSALALDIRQRRKQKLRVSSREPKTTIDTVLGYKKTHTSQENPPHEQIVIFDEAQRAWDAQKTAKYLDDKSAEYVGYSEPELILSILNRHPWATLVALVGGGQEINVGEAGLAEWGRALSKRFSGWRVAVSDQALTGEYGAGSRLFEGAIPGNITCTVDSSLHLDTPTRQFRGKTISLWAEALLIGDDANCREILSRNPNYPIYVTRQLDLAKRWLKDRARGTERFGCIASSEAKRLRADGLELPPARADGVEHWFLAPKGDVRSSFQLEIAANEFQIQGLEIDWACLCWGGDFLRTAKSDWALKRFRGTVWQNVGKPEIGQFIVNTYRVLLTRARQGMVLFVPYGDDDDPTRPKVPFERTAEFLVRCGANPLPRN